jgi:CDP-glycerol glycerophosphotransferase (TagB/SpsB family)
LVSVYFSHNLGQPHRYGYRDGDLDLLIFNADWVRNATEWLGRSFVLHPTIFPHSYKVTPGTAITQINLAAKKGGALFWQLAAKFPSQSFIGVLGKEPDQVVPLATERPKNVTLLEYTSDIKSVYARSRIILIPSQGYSGDIRWTNEHWGESYGRVAVEAAISGIPVVATRTPGIQEALGDRALYCGSDIGEWTNALARLNDANFFRACSDRAKSITEILTPDEDIDKLDVLLTELVEQAHSVNRKPAAKSYFEPVMRNAPTQLPRPPLQRTQVSGRSPFSETARIRLKLLRGLIPRGVTSLTYRALAHVVPKKKNLVVIMAPETGGFGDNAKYAYLELCDDPRLEVYYCCYAPTEAEALRREGVNCISPGTWQGDWRLLRAYTVVGTAVYAFRHRHGLLASRARKIQLWHGAGVKNVGLAMRRNRIRQISRYWRLRWMLEQSHPVFDIVYFTSDRLRRQREDSFNFATFRINGLLRNDLLRGKEYGGREVIGTDRDTGVKIDQLKQAGKKLVLLAPSWRKSETRIFGPAWPINFSALDEVLRSTDSYLVLKFHPRTPIEPLIGLRSDRIFEYDRGLDIYPYLKQFDLLVTDFSSLFSDFLLVSDQILFYLPESLLRDESHDISQLALNAISHARCNDFEKLLSEMGRHLQEERGVDLQFGPELFHDFTDSMSGERFHLDIRDLLGHEE